MEMSDIFTNGGTNPLSAFVDADFDYAAGMLTKAERKKQTLCCQ
jgi:hypothetical protein